MGLLGALLSVAIPLSAREQFRLPGGTPESIDEVVKAMRGGDPKTSIPAYLQESMCGGWDKNIGVGAYMSTVRGVPGRPHDWAGDITSGMGVRIDANGDKDSDNDYQYPESAVGLDTACMQGRDRDWKLVWEPVNVWTTVDGEDVTEYGQNWHQFAYPYFENPACRWRMEGNRWPEIPLTPDGELFGSNKDSWETEDNGSCLDFCQYLNSYLYRDCGDDEIQVRTITIPAGFDDEGNMLTQDVDLNVCNREAYRYVCTDQEAHDENWAVACFTSHPDPEEWANSRKCVGEQCRCPNAQKPETCVKTPGDQEYQSYYRLYSEARYERTALKQDSKGRDVAPRDANEKDFQATCFGFYEEFDPKTHLTQAQDRRCVINIGVEDMRETQKGKAEYKEQNVSDKDPTDPALQRPGGPDNERGKFDKEKDTWYKKLGGAFSFVNEKLFEKQYDSDLGNVFLAFDNLDDGELKATPQISDNQLLAESDLMRAFDDTGNPRAYVRWWQEQQTRMNALMRPPVLRIVLPSAWFVGIDPDDPFLSSPDGAEEATERAARNDRIELQIEADEDVLGTALAYIERSVLIHAEEEPIPVVVPMGSPAEFRARAADWCNWYKATKIVPTCDDAPEDVKKIMERLEEYAKRIDDYRELRAQTAKTAGKILELQHKLLEPIAQWFKDHEGQLKDIAGGRERAERELLPAWREAQASVAKLHERSNMPWCMNQRFTAPIYSLDDSWLPSRGLPQGVEINEMGLPVLPLVERPQDVIIDFSAVAAMSGTIKIPVLKPVQIRIDIPTPPTTGELAELPRVGDIAAAMEDALGKLPEVENQLQEPPGLEPPPPLGAEIIENARATLQQIQAVTAGMNERYEKFWMSIGPLKPGEEQFDRQIELKTGMKCFDFETMPCEQVEMDLHERIQRIGSRPLVQLFDDFRSIGTPRSEPTVCLPEDDACHILNAEKTDPGFRWEVKGSAANDAPIDELKLKILKLTQPPPLGTVDPLLLQPHDDDPSPLQSFPPIRLLP